MDVVRRADQVASEASAQIGELEFLYKSGVALRPGGTPDISRRWNRRDRDPKTFSPGGAADRSWSAAPPGLPNISLLASGGYAALHHRLISAAPPAQKTCVETLARQFAPRVHSTIAGNWASSIVAVSTYPREERERRKLDSLRYD